jgi:ABC-type uncharacterized transport system substrate-binding protein
MSQIRLYLNLDAAEKQGVQFSSEVIKRASDVIGLGASSAELGGF